MKLGAQFFSIRTACTTPDELGIAFKKIKDIGYDSVQISGVCDIEASRLKSFSDETGLPIALTHKSFDLITTETEYLIKYHKEIGCSVIGLSCPKDRNKLTSIEAVREFISELRPAVNKILDSGLTFAYHNHAFEFNDIGGITMYDLMIEEAQEFNFIHDVYWSTFGGYDPLHYIKLLASSGRMTNIHIKDMKTAPKGPICACGEGVIDLPSIIKLATECGVENALVEQDNAPDFGDPFLEMKKSYEYLKPFFNK